jgi:hypothetical protein
LRPVSDEAWAPVSSEHALISPAAAAGGAEADAEGEADGELLALADAAAEVAALGDVLAEGDADRFGLSESACVSVAGGLLAGVRAADACELLLHAVAQRARTAMPTVAARVFSRMTAPRRRRNRASRMLEANSRPVTAA